MQGPFLFGSYFLLCVNKSMHSLIPISLGPRFTFFDFLFYPFSSDFSIAQKALKCSLFIFYLPYYSLRFTFLFKSVQFALLGSTISAIKQFVIKYIETHSNFKYSKNGGAIYAGAKYKQRSNPWAYRRYHS